MEDPKIHIDGIDPDELAELLGEPPLEITQESLQATSRISEEVGLKFRSEGVDGLRQLIHEAGTQDEIARSETMCAVITLLAGAAKPSDEISSEAEQGRDLLLEVSRDPSIKVQEVFAQNAPLGFPEFEMRLAEMVFDPACSRDARLTAVLSLGEGIVSSETRAIVLAELRKHRDAPGRFDFDGQIGKGFNLAIDLLSDAIERGGDLIPHNDKLKGMLARRS